MSKKLYIRFLWICAVLVNIKSIFADFDIDTSYALAMSYRNLQGDKMFLQMLEPHQTSSFLTTILLYPYEKIFGLTGSILYLHICGVLLYALVTFVLFRFLRRYLADPALCHYICIFFFAVRAKQIVFPEFSNMMICFSVLLFVSFTNYIKEQDHKRYLIQSGIFLCLEILSYPSAILTFCGLAFFIIRYARRKMQDLLILTGTCLALGSVYVLYFIATRGFSSLLNGLLQMARGDASHGTGVFASFVSMAYYKDFLIGAGILCLSCLCAFVLSRLFRKKDLFYPSTILLFFLFTVCRIVIAHFDSGNVYYTASILFVYLILIGRKNLSSCTKEEVSLYHTGCMISGFSLLSVILLSNLPLSTALWYIILAVCVSFIPVFARARTAPSFTRIVLIPFLLLILFHRGFISTDPPAHSDILHLRTVYRQGPALGIAGTYFPAYQNSVNTEEFAQNISADDNLLLVAGSPALNSLDYLDTPAGISHYSTICTPTYDDLLFDYWEEYPEKKPTVIAVECWYGDLRVDADSEIMKRISSEYTEWTDGTFWRFYRCPD